MPASPIPTKEASEPVRRPASERRSRMLLCERRLTLCFEHGDRHKKWSTGDEEGRGLKENPVIV